MFRERESDLLATAKCWGNGLFREREIETDLLAAAKWWGNGLFGERLICWLLQSIGGMGCSGREINLLAAVKQQGRGV